jgi:N-acetylglucosamine-6-phosphate deacetylase
MSASLAKDGAKPKAFSARAASAGAVVPSVTTGQVGDDPSDDSGAIVATGAAAGSTARSGALAEANARVNRAYQPGDDVAVISDCIAAYRPGKRFLYNGRTIVVRPSGGCCLCDEHGNPTATLAGSTATQADQFLSLVTTFGCDLAQACRMLATTPARIANVNHVGAIEVGRKANLLLLNGACNTIERRMVYGRWLDELPPYKMLRPALSNL